MKNYNEDELKIEKLLETIGAGEDDQSESKSQAVKIIKLVKEQDVVLFHDQFNKAYAAPHGDGRNPMRLSSQTFKNWLSSLVWKELNIAAGSTAISTAINVLSGEANNDGAMHTLHVRVAFHENCIWYDIGNGSAVRIDKSGWHIIEKPPILFHRFNHQKKQVMPKSGRKINEVLGLLNLKNKDEQLLFMIALVVSFIPDIPHPIIVSHGPQGSAKSMLHRIMKSIVDPSQTSLLSPPGEIREFIQTASHHWVITLDNLSHLQDWLSDALCKVCTGSGFSKRELYTDDDDIIYSLKHIVGLNGISLVVTKPDLLDRSILLEHESIPTSKKMGEEEIANKFKESKPFILGAIFDTLSKALELKQNLKIANLPRMADFTQWGCAVALAMGLKQEDFLDAYKKNIAQQHDEALEASLIGTAILKLMEETDKYEGTATDLLKKLNYTATILEIDRRRSWPKNANMVWKEIVKIKTNLEAKGIVADKSKSGARKITLIKTK